MTISKEANMNFIKSNNAILYPEEKIDYPGHLYEIFGMMDKSIENSISALSKTIEIKDPYTHNHHKRIRMLASSIAQEMGIFDRGILKNIYLAASVHDIGKIGIPTDILNKSDRWTEHEFDLVKAHPEFGYEILKTLEFSWPIEQIVLQHHEKMDGSGYPQGLKGDKILTEARVISVADAFDNLHSHRPHRPALEIDLALDKIKKESGTSYDPLVVSALLRLFKRKEIH
jgi:HD-GYP domain-containing protein (c-di-GMP phosphodiesterase class II)